MYGTAKRSATVPESTEDLLRRLAQKLPPDQREALLERELLSISGSATGDKDKPETRQGNPRSPATTGMRNERTCPP
jgi:hypothetical protein